MIKQKELCIECYEILSNPICIDCLGREMVVWLRDKELSWDIKREILGELKKTFSGYNDLNFDMSCVICGKQNISVCSYCFTRRAYLALKKFTVSREMIKDFLSVFNYWKGFENFEEERVYA